MAQPQPLGVDHRATALAKSVLTCIHPLERAIDLFELGKRGLFDCLKNFVVLNDDCGVGRITRQRVGLTAQIVMDAAHSLTQLALRAKSHWRALLSLSSIMVCMGAIVASARGGPHSLVYL